MKRALFMVLVPLALSACGHKGNLRTPTEAQREESKRAREETKRQQWKEKEQQAPNTEELKSDGSL